MLEIKDLSVEVEGKPILEGVNLRIEDGESCVLLGPNGSGKSTLIQTIVGNPKYKVTGGKILFDGKEITETPANERAKEGIAVAFQQPPAVRGVKLIDLLRHICSDEERIRAVASELNMSQFLERDVNLGFSGGELKRSEMLQLLLMDPKLSLFDEPDSGVDVENLELIGKAMNLLLKSEKPRTRKNSGLIITHMGSIMQYVRADKGFIMFDGTIACSGNPTELLEDVKQNGYEGCVRCRTRC
ncbi:MAG: ABC transporter ATP-binding protein [Candidatus Thermoplasmatota archaeon]|nr:ABC transporter ATP-binding protein [Candidatus Thermoplasmatota archaeon]